MQITSILLEIDNNAITSSIAFLYRTDSLTEAQTTVSKHWRQMPKLNPFYPNWTYIDIRQPTQRLHTDQLTWHIMNNNTELLSENEVAKINGIIITVLSSNWLQQYPQQQHHNHSKYRVTDNSQYTTVSKVKHKKIVVERTANQYSLAFIIIRVSWENMHTVSS